MLLTKWIPADRGCFLAEPTISVSMDALLATGQGGGSSPPKSGMVMVMRGRRMRMRGIVGILGIVGCEVIGHVVEDDIDIKGADIDIDDVDVRVSEEGRQSGSGPANAVF